MRALGYRTVDLLVDTLTDADARPLRRRRRPSYSKTCSSTCSIRLRTGHGTPEPGGLTSGEILTGITLRRRA
jgi:hypothetical protein